MTAEIVFVSLALLILLYILLILPGKCTEKQCSKFAKHNYAHRGLHSKDKVITENSLAAFERAANFGYGIELDIRLSKDGQVVVFHDDRLNRVCGYDARVDELDYSDLIKLHLCDTDEKMPLFTDVLKLIDGRVPVIVEIKNGKNNNELCKKAIEILKNYNGDFCIESFNPLIVAWFRRNAPHVFRGQLTSSFHELKGGSKAAFAFIVSRVLLNFLARPQFIAHSKEKKSLSVRICQALGAVKIVWTIRDANDCIKYEQQNDAVIFEFYKPAVHY